MKEIGGFFELELNNHGNTFHDETLAFNSGSSALLFFLKHSSYKEIYIPYYTCESVVDTIKRAKLTFHFYRLDYDLRPIVDYKIFDSNTLLIYNDYFGLNTSNIEEVYLHTDHVVIDAAQSFFYKAKGKRIYINSVRKFFGVPDGGFLSCKTSEKVIIAYENLVQTDYSSSHLINKLENGAEFSYQDYLKNEIKLASNKIGKMSKLTISLLKNRDFENVKSKRISNFQILDNILGEFNRLNLSMLNKKVTPMCYPFLFKNGDMIKKHLIENKIFVPTYWPNIRSMFNEKCEFENDLIDNLICLPIDQRYSDSDMNQILNQLKLFINE